MYFLFALLAVMSVLARQDSHNIALIARHIDYAGSHGDECLAPTNCQWSVATIVVYFSCFSDMADRKGYLRSIILLRGIS